MNNTVFSQIPVQMLNTELCQVTLGTSTEVPSGFVEFYTLNPGYETNGPHNLVDENTSTVIAQIPQWNPRRRIYNYALLPAVDIISAIDLAVYNYTYPNTGDQTQYPLPIQACFGSMLETNVFDPYFFTCSMIPSGDVITLPTATQPNNVSWRYQQLGTVWVDTSNLLFTQYDDSYINSNITNRLHNWGSIMYGTPTVYEWTISSFSPIDWPNIPEGYYDTIVGEYKSGTPKQTVFQRVRQPYPILQPEIIPGNPATYTSFLQLNTPTTMANPFQVGDYVIFSSNNSSNNSNSNTGSNTSSITSSGILPTPLQPQTKYYVFDTIGNNLIGIADMTTHTPIALTLSGPASANFYAIPPFPTNGWTRNHTVAVDVFVGTIFQEQMPNPFSNIIIPIPENLFAEGSIVTVYLNGTFVLDSAQVLGNAVRCVSLGVALTPSDIFTIVLPQYTPTSAQLNFDPEVADNGSVMTQYDIFTEYSTYTVTNNNALVTVYCFWVTGKTSPLVKNSGYTTNLVQALVTSNSSPYMIIDGFNNRESIATPNNPTVNLPYRYDKLIFRQISEYITTNNRFTIELNQNSTMRDSLYLDERTDTPLIYNLFHKYTYVPTCNTNSGVTDCSNTSSNSNTSNN